MKFRRFLAQAGLACVFSFAAFKGAEAWAPAPDVTPVFNNAAAVPEQKAREYRIPSLQEPDAAAKKDLWRVRIGAWEMGAGGHHTFVEFSPYDENDATRRGAYEIYQIHGIACDEVRRTWGYLNPKDIEAYRRYGRGDYVLKGLGINLDHSRKYFQQKPDVYVDVFYGSKDEVLKMYLDGMTIIEGVNATNDPYILLSHNSNSVQRTVLDAIGLKEPPIFVPHKIEAVGGRIWTPGIEKSLLLKDWESEKAREQGGYAGLSGADLEKRAKDLQGADRMFATFRDRSARPKGPS